MESTSTRSEKRNQQKELQEAMMKEKTLSEYYQKKLKYLEEYHNVKNITAWFCIIISTGNREAPLSSL